ncbi:PRC-barrel domain-containing protein [Primorskyibacter sp. 2E107]|uniref:PRC-barrel domain-containing protein n=1 Tax=Primorskyibacter sp. 2E107 TaxID=3403458 RepID=UPI003AF52380
MKRTTMTAIATLMVVPGFALAESHANADADAKMKTEQSEMAEGAETMAQEAETEMAEGAEAVENAAEATGEAVADGADAAGEMANDAATEMAETADEMTDGMTDMAQFIRTRDITGGAVYTMQQSSDAVWDGDLMYDTVGENWDKVGEIEDVVLSASGEFKGIIAEVGGFLDIGDKHIMLPIDNVKLVPVDDASYAIVTPYSLDELKGMEGVDEASWN